MFFKHRTSLTMAEYPHFERYTETEPMERLAEAPVTPTVGQVLVAWKSRQNHQNYCIVTIGVLPHTPIPPPPMHVAELSMVHMMGLHVIF